LFGKPIRRLGIELRVQTLKPRILLIGHSHTLCVRAALEESLAQGAIADYRWLDLRAEQYIPEIDPVSDRLHPAIEQEIEQWLAESPDPAMDRALISLTGNEHNVFGLVQSPAPFDFVLPEAEEVPLLPEAPVIPYGAFLRLMRERIEWNHVEERILPGGRVRNRSLSLAAAIGKLLPMQPVWFSPPPPNGDETFICANAGQFAERLQRHGVTPKSLRLKIWKVQTAILRQWCRAHGWQFMEPPAEMRTEDGFMAPLAYGNDPTHGNIEYGRCVLKQSLLAADARANHSSGAD